MTALGALRKHWCTIDAMGRFEGDPAEPTLPSAFTRMTVWLALLYVVVEGYKEIGRHDYRVDHFLSFGDRVDELRRFRNCIFHYQMDGDDPRLGQFLDREACLGWAHELSRALDEFLNRELANEA